MNDGCDFDLGCYGYILLISHYKMNYDRNRKYVIMRKKNGDYEYELEMYSFNADEVKRRMKELGLFLRKEIRRERKLKMKRCSNGRTYDLMCMRKVCFEI